MGHSARGGNEKLVNNHRGRHPRFVHKLTRVEHMYSSNTALFDGRGTSRTLC